MGKFRKISLVVFYTLQVLVICQESFGLIYENAFHDASLALSGHAGGNPLLTLLQKPEAGHAYQIASIAAANGRNDYLKYEEHDRDTHEAAEDHTAASHRSARRRRLSMVLIRNLFSDTREISPTGAVEERIVKIASKQARRLN